MAGPTNGDTSVNYTVKEILAEMKRETSESLTSIEAKIDTLSGNIQTKADATAVVALAVRVAALETGSARSQGASEYRRWLMPSMVAVMMQVVGWGLAYSWWGTPHG